MSQPRLRERRLRFCVAPSRAYDAGNGSPRERTMADGKRIVVFGAGAIGGYTGGISEPI